MSDVVGADSPEPPSGGDPMSDVVVDSPEPPSVGDRMSDVVVVDSPEPSSGGDPMSDVVGDTSEVNNRYLDVLTQSDHSTSSV